MARDDEDAGRPGLLGPRLPSGKRRAGTAAGPDDPFDTPEKAYAEAERRIAKARREGATELVLGVRFGRAKEVPLLRLERLPPSIAGLTALKSLSLDSTQVADLAPLAGLTALQIFSLGSTKVADLAPLAGLTALQVLFLSSTQVADLAPLAGLTALQTLLLGRTPVADLAPLAGLTALQTLFLGSTPVADLAPLAGLTALQTLFLGSTPVADLAPLAGLTALQSLSLDSTPVADLAPLAGLTALQILSLNSTPVADLAPLAGLTALQSLSLDSTQVADLAPLAGLTALQTLSLDSTQVADLAPLAGLTSLSSAAQADSEPITRGVRFAATPVARTGPFDVLVSLKQPASTVETINYLRRQQGLPEYFPEGYERPDGIDELLKVEGRGARKQVDLESEKVVEALLREQPLSLGITYVISGDRFSASFAASSSDELAAAEPTTRQLHESVRRKAEAFYSYARRLDNSIGWEGIGSAARRFSESINGDLPAVVCRIAEVWSNIVELGSFLELDQQLRQASTSNASPLEPEVRRVFADLIRTAAPWVRRFPSACRLDDDAGAFLTRKDLLEPAKEVFVAAGNADALTREDREVLLALVAAAQRGDFQSAKASARSYASARNLALAAALTLGGFYVGATQNVVAEKSPIVKKAGKVFLDAEKHVVKLFEDAQPDIRLAIEYLLQRLKVEHQAPDLPLPTRTADRGPAPPRRPSRRED